MGVPATKREGANEPGSIKSLAAVPYNQEQRILAGIRVGKMWLGMP